MHHEQVENLEGKMQIYYCNTLVREFWTVASRPKFRKHFTLRQASAFIQSFLSICEEVSVVSSLDVSRAVKDSFLLALSDTVKANYLVSGDRDLLVLKSRCNTQIITLNSFVSITEEDFR